MNDMNFAKASLAGEKKPTGTSEVAKGIRAQDVKKPSQTFMFTEWFAGSLVTEPAFSASSHPIGVISVLEMLNFRYHANVRGNVAFFDGHAAQVNYKSVKFEASATPWTWWDYRWDDK
jgi:prepilin-type processing-associated H-X9-DG protein